MAVATTAKATRPRRKASKTSRPIKRSVEFPGVDPSLSHLLTVCFDGVGDRTDYHSSAYRKSITKAALAHGVDVRPRLLGVLQRSRGNTQLMIELAEVLPHVPMTDALRSEVASGWAVAKAYATEPQVIVPWLELARLVGDKPWARRLDKKLGATLAELPADVRARHRSALADHDSFDKALKQEMKAGGDRVADRVLDAAVRNRDADLAELAFPFIDLDDTYASGKLRDASFLARLRPDLAAALLANLDPETLEAAFTANESCDVMGRAVLEGLTRLDGALGARAREGLARRLAQRTGPEMMEQYGVSRLVEFIARETTREQPQLDEYPALTPEHVASAVAENLESNHSKSDKVRFRADAVAVLAHTGAIDEAVALTKILRRKLGSSNLAKQSHVRAWTTLAAAEAAQGRWDRALQWADQTAKAIADWGIRHEAGATRHFRTIATGIERGATVLPPEASA